MERLLPLERGTNFRELGGYSTQDGHKLKLHKLIRSGSLAELTTNDLRFLENYGVHYDIDFRAEDEKKAAPDRVPGEAEYVFDPVFHFDETENSKSTDELEKEFREDPLIGHQRMINVYHNVVNNELSHQAYRRFFDYLLQNEAPDSTLLFHCTAGKDRTGFGAMLLLTALGVDAVTIKQDYLLTNTTSASFIENRLQSMAQRPDTTAAAVASMYSLLTVQEAYYNTALHDIETNFGSVKSFLHEQIQVSNSEIADLKKIYVA